MQFCWTFVLPFAYSFFWISSNLPVLGLKAMDRSSRAFRTCSSYCRRSSCRSLSSCSRASLNSASSFAAASLTCFRALRISLKSLSVMDPNQAANSCLVDRPGIKISEQSNSVPRSSMSDSAIPGHFDRMSEKVGVKPVANAMRACSCSGFPLPKRGTKNARRLILSSMTIFAVVSPTGCQNSGDGVLRPRPCLRAAICSSFASNSGFMTRSAASCDCIEKVKANWSILTSAS
mmetsp:Transcript_126770/g.355002  ORF Transcript_126770/g.355002 Transcript_126770/m.355002 type:complete len:233 (-) Transcript_126770:1482-2180(-)